MLAACTWQSVLQPKMGSGKQASGLQAAQLKRPGSGGRIHWGAPHSWGVERGGGKQGHGTERGKGEAPEGTAGRSHKEERAGRVRQKSRQGQSHMLQERWGGCPQGPVQLEEQFLRWLSLPVTSEESPIHATRAICACLSEEAGECARCAEGLGGQTEQAHHLHVRSLSLSFLSVKWDL